MARLDFNINELNLQQEEVAGAKFVHYKDFEQMLKENKKDFVDHDEEYEKLMIYLNERL